MNLNKNILCVIAAIITILFLTVMDSRGQFGFNNVAVVGSFTATTTSSGGGGCTLTSGNLYNESWEASDTLTWSDTGTVDRSAALPGTSPCSGLGSQCVAVNWNGSDTRPWAQWDRGSLLNSTLYYRFYFYVSSSSMADTGRNDILSVSESADPTASGSTGFLVRIRNNATQYVAEIQTTAATSTAINISVATWYRAEIKYVPNNGAGASEFKIFDSAGTQVSTTQTFNTANNWLRYLAVGIPRTDNTSAFSVSIDGLGISDVGYIGQ